MTAPPLLTVRDVIVDYRPPGRIYGQAVKRVRAVAGVSFDIRAGESMSLVGESGCGKTSLGRAILGLVPLTAGSITFDGQDIHSLKGAARRALRRQMQVVFQNPYQTLNPRLRVDKMLMEPMIAHRIAGKSAARERAAELLRVVGLNADHLHRFPHEFSGGQRQRLGIARSLAANPQLLICDEPTSALDVSVRAQILNLLAELRDTRGLTYLLITHDLSIVSSMSETLAVMYLGRIVELAPTSVLYSMPRHPYTAALMSAAPVPDPLIERSRKRVPLIGDVPSPINRPSGCGFRPRCWLYQRLGRPAECDTKDPDLTPAGSTDGHRAACHFSSAVDTLNSDASSSAPPQPAAAPVLRQPGIDV